MDGMPLYDYARKGIPLPRPIEKRRVTVHSLELTEWKGTNHSFHWPEKRLSEENIAAMKKALHNIEGDATSTESEPETPANGEFSTAFVLTMKVSGGTYVRSIVHDLGRALGSAGHVVTLTRTRQGQFTLNPEEDSDKGCLPWDVFVKALEDPGPRDVEGWTEWERSIMDNLEVVESGG
jgi:tRNA pseudouridine55 synthase